MAQLARPVEPFGEVNVYRVPEGLQVVAKVLAVPNWEGARTGLALDGSVSMKALYGDSPFVSGPFAKKGTNLVEPVARLMAEFLAKFAADGRVSMVYWAVAPDGSAVEELGRPNLDELSQMSISGPRNQPWGRDTKLLPVVRYFVERAFDGAQRSIAVIITDGLFTDMAELKIYCQALGTQIASGLRPPVKLVLIGLGEEVAKHEHLLEELDDMFEGSGLRTPDGEEVDIWDHKLAAEMQKLEEVFAEAVTENMVVVDRGTVLDDQGRVAQDYPHGVPALLRFTLAPDATAFTLRSDDVAVTQDIREVLGKLS